jgi:hypothetical protein
MAVFAGNKGGPQFSQVESSPPAENKADGAEAGHGPGHWTRQMPKDQVAVAASRINSEKKEEPCNGEQAIR